MKKHLLISAIALAMVGCGGDSKKSTPTPDPVPTSSSKAAEPVPSSSSSKSSSSAAPATWNLVWSDEFNGSNLDTTKWSFEKNCTGGGNNELQCYTDRADNAFLADGMLHIVAKKEPFSGQAKGDDDPTYDAADTSAKRDYTSARLRTKGKGDWKYGRIDIRAKLPQGTGLWPAIWMLPTEWKYGSWPLSGEIDIMEAVNPNTKGGNTIHGTLHYGDKWPGNKNSGTSVVPSTKVWDEFHTYSIQWEEGEVRWYIDDKHYSTHTSAGWYTTASEKTTAPFDEKFHLLLNVAVGGQWPGNPDETSTFPQEMTIDYVKVYECSADKVKGKGCATNVDANIKPLAGNKRPGPSSTITNSFDVFKEALDPQWDYGIGTYNATGTITTAIIDAAEPAHGKVIDIKYSGSGLAYIQATGPKDVTVFTGSSYLEFDVKVMDYKSAAGLIVKVDCGHPCSSGDISIGKVGDGAWETVRVPISRFTAGGLALSKMNTPFVIFPTWDKQAGVNIQVDNIRWVLSAGGADTNTPTTFAPLPLFTMYDNAVASSLTVNSYNPSGAITSSSIMDSDSAHGQVFNVVKKSAAGGNVSFGISSGAKDLDHWKAAGKLKFDVKLNSTTASSLLIKIGNGWPNVSDIDIASSLVKGQWVSYEIAISTLIAKRNSLDSSGIANIKSIVEMLVIEPAAAMDVSFDNIRYE